MKLFIYRWYPEQGTIPQSEVDQLQLVNGGIEAKYGDVSGGVISLTSKDQARLLQVVLKMETSEGLDVFGYNLLSANFSGPILKNSKNKRYWAEIFPANTSMLMTPLSAVGA